MADITGAPAYIANPTGVESRVSGVSWGAIVAGGVASAAMALILMTLGAGLGLISVSPWPNEGASAEAVGIGVIVWSIVIEVAAFGLGGYLAGRLRTKWASLHGDEVYFRDTAQWLRHLGAGHPGQHRPGHGGGGPCRPRHGRGRRGRHRRWRCGSCAAGPALMEGADRGRMAGPGRGNPMDYYVDLLFRPTGTAPAAATTGTDGSTTMTPATPAPMAPAGPANDVNADRGQIMHIVAASFKDGNFTLAPEDKTYIAQLIAQRTGLSQPEAEKRVDDTIAKAKAAIDAATTKAKEAADTARKAAAGLALWSFIAMLIGAFVASYAATIGGRHRDL